MASDGEAFQLRYLRAPWSIFIFASTVSTQRLQALKEKWSQVIWYDHILYT